MSPRRSRWWASAGECLLLWWLSATTLATFGVGHTRGIHVSSGVESMDEAAMTVQRGPPHESFSGAMALEDTTSSVATGQDYDSEERRQDVSLCLLLIVRDEEESLKANLPLWRDVADCFVIGVDDRTTDGTTSTIQQVLGNDKARFVFFFTFQDFAQARNAVLRSTAHNFPDASHVIVADADWRPDLATVDKSELDFVHGSFPFVVWDSSGHTSRLVGWLVRFDKHLRFKYRVHEALDFTATVASASPSKIVGWEVRVVESDSNWNANLHQHSRNSERFLFDLTFLELDYQDDPTDLHTLFYLGITKFAYIESLMGKGTHEKTPELEAIVASGMSYLGQAVRLHGEVKNSEFVWGSKRWLAYGYYYFIGDSERAKRAYEDCIEYDPARVDCVVFLSRLYLDNGDLDAAWDTAKMGLLHRPPAGLVLTYFYTFECFASAQAANVISKRISAPGSPGNDSVEGLLTLGWYLVHHHRDHCNHGVMVDSPEDIDRLESGFEEAIARQGLNVEEIKRATLLNDEGSLLALLLGTWGTGEKASSAWYHDTPKQQQLPSAAAAAAATAATADAADAEDEMSDMNADELRLPQSSFAARLPNDASGSQHQSAAVSSRSTPEPQGTEPEMDVRRSSSADPGTDAAGRKKNTSRWAAFASESCEKIIGEARARLGLDGQQAVPGALAAASLVQINAVMATAAAAAERRSRLDGGGSFRALIFSGAGGGGVAPGKTGLEHEELLQVVSLLLQLSSSPTRSEVTYANPDSSVVEAAQSVASRCVNEFGIAGGGRVRLDFVRSSLDDFLLHTTVVDQQFDYVDVGGPLSWSGGGRNGNGRDTAATTADAATAAPPADAALLPAAVLHADTLRLLGPKLAPGACLKAWAFARNPSTSSAFRAAARDKTRQAATASTTGWTAEQDSGSRTAFDMLERVLRTQFGIGQVAPFPPHAKSPTLTETDEEEVWVRQVLAGGDRLSIPDIDEVLAGGGFELALILGKKNTDERGMEEELLGEGLSRWEMAEIADSLELMPALVHQVLAAWRGDGSSVIALSQ